MLGFFLLYTTINCIDAADMIGRLNAHEGMSDAVKAELVEVIQEATNIAHGTQTTKGTGPKNPTTLGENDDYHQHTVALSMTLKGYKAKVLSEKEQHATMNSCIGIKVERKFASKS